MEAIVRRIFQPLLKEQLSWRDLFPTFDNPQLIDPKSIGIVRLCAKINLPFPVESNAGYATWWHLLHEVGHWAVKPPNYLEYSNWMRDDITVTRGRLLIPAGTIPGVEKPVDIPNFRMYGAGNDLIPNVALLYDTTPNEFETRVWSLDVIERFGWPHPFDENKMNGVADVTSGDSAFHKISSGRVWFRGQAGDQSIRRSMANWAIDPLSNRFRAMDDGFVVPYLAPVTSSHLIANMDAMHNHYNPEVVNKADREEWIEDYLLPRYRKYLV